MADLHTPGKWQVFERDGRPPFPFEVRVYVGPEDRPTAYYTVAMLRSLAHDRWDAHLIAAAPDLLAALYATQAAFAPETIADPTFDPHRVIERDEAVGMMLAAIAKARGEAPRAE